MLDIEAPARRPTAMPAERIIPDRGEFIDALRALRRGHLMVKLADRPGACLIDGGIVYHSMPTLVRYGLVQRFDNPDGFPEVEYYRLSREGFAFAEKALGTWRRRPLLERLAVRLAG